MKMFDEVSEIDQDVVEQLRPSSTVMPEKLAISLIKGVGSVNDRSAEAFDIMNDYYSE